MVPTDAVSSEAAASVTSSARIRSRKASERLPYPRVPMSASNCARSAASMATPMRLSVPPRGRCPRGRRSVPVDVRVRVREGLAMAVAVCVHEIGPLKEIEIREDVRGSLVRGDLSPLEHEAPVGDVLDEPEIVRGCHDGTAAIAPLHEQIDDLALAAG